MTDPLQAFVGAPVEVPAGALGVGVKDVIRVDGFPTLAGSRLPPDLFDGPEATCVTRLRAAGAVVAGKTHTAEFAWAAPGPTRNPVDPARTPGGSSSGSAAAVGAGMVPLALGTQTIGSVIRPASFCGVYGFKPTFGRVPIDGVIACAPSLDTLGWFAPDLDGLARAAAVLCDGWGEPATDGRIVGVPDGPYLDQAAPSTRRLFEAQVQLLAALGWTVRRVRVLDDIADIAAAHVRIVGAEMADVHRGWFGSYEQLYAPATADMIRWGLTLDDVTADRAGRAELRTRLEAAGVDVWLSPAATGPAPVGLDSTGDPAMNLPWTYAGLPVVSLPVGRVDGLPVGLQCAGRSGADETLLAAAAALVKSFVSVPSAPGR